MTGKRVPWYKGLAANLTSTTIFLVMVSLIIVGLILIQVAFRTQRVNTLLIQEQRASWIAQVISAFVLRVIEDLELLDLPSSTSPHNLADMRPALGNLLLKRTATFTQLWLVDQEGREVIHLSQFHTYLVAELAFQVESEAFIAATGGRTYVSPVYISPDSGLLSVRVGLPFRDWPGNILGVIIAEANVSRLWAEIAAMEIGRSGYAYLVDGQGRFLAYQVPSELLVRYGENLRELPPVRAFLGGRLPLSSEYHGLNGQPVLGAAAPIPGTTWAVVAELPSQEAYATVRQMQGYLFLLMLSGVAITGSVSLLLLHRLVRPIRELTEGAAAIAGGDLRYQVEVHTDDEIGELARSFNEMSHQVGTLYEELLHREERYRTLVENLNDVIFAVDTRGILTYISPTIERFSARRASELTGLSFGTYLHPDDLPALEATFAQALAGQPAAAEFRIFPDQGSVLHVHVSCRPLLEGEQVRGITGVITDVTRQREALEALAESEERFRMIFNSLNDALFLHDPETGAILDVNAKMCEMFGYTREEAMALTLEDLGVGEPPYSRDEAMGWIMRARQDGPQLFEWITRRRDGAPFWIEVNMRSASIGGKESILVVVRDVTERKEAERALSESEEKYRTILTRIEDGYFEVDTQGALTFCNPSLGRILANEGRSMMGQRLQDFMDPSTAVRFSEDLGHISRTGLITKLYDWVFLTPAGERVFAEASVSPLEDPPGFRGIVRDVTQRKRLETQLLHAQTMEAIGTLAGGIAHDFNNLLMGIQGYTSLILLDADAAHPHHEKLMSIEELVKSGAGLTKQLLGFARGGQYEVRPTDLNALIEKSIAVFGRTKKDVIIHTHFEATLWTVEVDQNQMEQVILNLFVNAWHAMPGGGELSIETLNVTLDEHYTRPHHIDPGPFVKFAVTDTGVGMDARTRERIFEPFFTTREKGRGTGLGLASVYGTIKAHGGLVNVYSEEGHGSTFTIYLPASSKAITRERHPEQALIRGEETILLVDDEETILTVNREALQSLGYKVYSALGGQEALEIYRLRRGEIDLVILDMIMPGMSGAQTFTALKGLDPKVRVLLASGYSLTDEARQIMAQGCRGYIQKPFSMTELSRKIREALEDPSLEGLP